MKIIIVVKNTVRNKESFHSVGTKYTSSTSTNIIIFYTIHFFFNIVLFSPDYFLLCITFTFRLRFRFSPENYLIYNSSLTVWNKVLGQNVHHLNLPILYYYIDGSRLLFQFSTLYCFLQITLHLIKKRHTV